MCKKTHTSLRESSNIEINTPYTEFMMSKKNNLVLGAEEAKQILNFSGSYL